MSGTVIYKGETFTTISNGVAKVLKTAGKFMEDDVTISITGGDGSPSFQTKTKTYTPTTSQQTETITADSGYDGLSSVGITVNAMAAGAASTPATTITTNMQVRGDN